MYATNEITLRIDLDEETAKKFKSLKKSKGLKHNTEVIRSLINDAYNEIEVPASV